MKQMKTKKHQTVNEKSLTVAIDIGKSVHYGYFRTPQGCDVKPFPFRNTHRHFEDLWNKIVQYKTEHNLETIIIGFESTGPYAEPLVHYMVHKPVHLVQINPMHTKRMKELIDNSPNKTDRKDPRIIADVIALGHALSVVIPQGSAAELRRLIGARERTIKSRTMLMNQLHTLLYLVFPEFSQVIKNIKTKSALYVLKHYPTPESIVSLGLTSIGMVLKMVSRGKIQKQKVVRLFEAAQHSVGIHEGRESILLEVEHLVSDIENKNRFIEKMKEKIHYHLTCIPYSQSMLSLKGVGPVTIAGLIGEVGDFGKFKTISDIMKLAGLNLYEVSSGKHRGRRHISKRGRSVMRKLLFFAAIKTVRSNGIMYRRYHDMLDRGMPRIKALVAIARKLLRILFALARDNMVYCYDYNKEHTVALAA
jgi:transposase